jgi:hypothetical protein
MLRKTFVSYCRHYYERASDEITICELMWQLLLFPTRLLTSEDEYKWLRHQMIYFPGTINIVSTQLYCHNYIH